MLPLSIPGPSNLTVNLMGLYCLYLTMQMLPVRKVAVTLLFRSSSKKSTGPETIILQYKGTGIAAV
jgi:hypothetical protein